MNLQNKRCTNTAETSLIVLEINRRKKLITETGGSAPPNDILTSVLLCSMEPGTRSNVAGKIDVSDDVDHAELRAAVNAHVNLA